jgi:hypothetical protein
MCRRANHNQRHNSEIRVPETRIKSEFRVSTSECSESQSQRDSPGAPRISSAAEG